MKDKSQKQAEQIAATLATELSLSSITRTQLQEMRCKAQELLALLQNAEAMVRS